MKVYRIALLNLLGVLLFAIAVWAAPEFWVDFDTTDPDITVTAFKHWDSSTSGWWIDAVAEFVLNGTGHVSGSIGASTGEYLFPWATKVDNKPNVWGQFSSLGGDLEWGFRADAWVQQGTYTATRYFSGHFVSAEDVIGTFGGDAYATPHDNAWVYGSGQWFDGSATSASIGAWRLVQGYKKSSGWDTPVSETGADLSVAINGSSPFDFSGYTEDRTFQYYHSGAFGVPESRTGGTPIEPWQCRKYQGLGFDIMVNGGSLSGSLYTNFPYADVMLMPDRILGETATWPGYPGLYGDPR